MFPSFASLKANYPNGDPDYVKALIGGNVNAPWITNTCVIRMCYALNHAGYPIHDGHGMTTIKGGDGFRYGFRVSEFRPYLEHAIGKATLKGSESAMGGKQGIIMFDVRTWSDATGHFDLWDGAGCSHECYFPQSKEVMLWELH